MGYQVIKQPGGELAIRSSYTDTIVVWDATRDEVVEWFADLAAADARRTVGRRVDLVLADKPREAYHQFAVGWDKAVADDRERGGEYSQAVTTQPN